MYMHLLGTIVMSHNTYFTTLQRNKPGDQACALQPTGAAPSSRFLIIFLDFTASLTYQSVLHRH